MKIKQHLPSIFTLINLFLGFLAIINTMAGDYVIACYIILAAGAFDSVDGKIARLIGISTNFGKEILNEPSPVIRVQSTQRCVNNEGKGPSRDFSKRFKH